jgi:hypothetical protein
MIRVIRISWVIWMIRVSWVIWVIRVIILVSITFLQFPQWFLQFTCEDSVVSSVVS